MRGSFLRFQGFVVVFYRVLCYVTAVPPQKIISGFQEDVTKNISHDLSVRPSESSDDLSAWRSHSTPQRAFLQMSWFERKANKIRKDNHILLFTPLITPVGFCRYARPHRKPHAPQGDKIPRFRLSLAP